MATVRVAPTPGAQTMMTINGRDYFCLLGASIDVPDFDANILTANGWATLGLVGPSSARPTTGPDVMVLRDGLKFIDLTLGKTIMWAGSPNGGGRWIDPMTGATV